MPRFRKSTGRRRSIRARGEMASLLALDVQNQRGSASSCCAPFNATLPQRMAAVGGWPLAARPDHSLGDLDSLDHDSQQSLTVVVIVPAHLDPKRKRRSGDGFGEVRSASLLERRGFEPPVLFGLFPVRKTGRRPAVFAQNLPPDRSESNSLIGFRAVTP
jgi:hypothetical protein